ncbi:GtrA family protein, partial [Enterococcus faecium]|nr:GtrA family protein [Enterococcus faecium]
VAKIITQIIVILANYIFSKLFIFKETEVFEEEVGQSEKDD